MSELVVRKIADHFARQGGGGGFMGWVIRDPRIIWWGGRGGLLDPRGSVIRGPPTTLCILRNIPKFCTGCSGAGHGACERREMTDSTKNGLQVLAQKMHFFMQLSMVLRNTWAIVG